MTLLPISHGIHCWVITWDVTCTRTAKSKENTASFCRDGLGTASKVYVDTACFVCVSVYVCQSLKTRVSIQIQVPTKYQENTFSNHGIGKGGETICLIIDWRRPGDAEYCCSAFHFPGGFALVMYSVCANNLLMAGTWQAMFAVHLCDSHMTWLGEPRRLTWESLWSSVPNTRQGPQVSRVS